MKVPNVSLLGFDKWYPWNRPTILIVMYYSLELIAVCWSALHVMMLWLVTDISHHLPGSDRVSLQRWAGHSSGHSPTTCCLCTVGQATENVSFLYSLSAELGMSQVCDVCSGDARKAAEKSSGFLLGWPNGREQSFKLTQSFRVSCPWSAVSIVLCLEEGRENIRGVWAMMEKDAFLLEASGL